MGGTVGRAGLASGIVAAARGRARVLIGIVGAPGAGKSTVAAGLVSELAALGLPSVALPMDGFHLPQARLVELGRRERMGAPDTFDVDGFVSALEAVRDPSAPRRAPLFDRSLEEPVPDALEVGTGVRVVLVEGNYLLHDEGGWERVAPLLDTVVALELAPGLRRERLIARHVAFGKTPGEAEAWVDGPDEANARLVAESVRRSTGSTVTRVTVG